MKRTAYVLVLLALASLARADFDGPRPSISLGSVKGPVTVASAIAGVQLAAAIEHGVLVTLPAGAIAVRVVPLAGVCSTALTTPVGGVRITAGNGYLFTPWEMGWNGQLCAILESAGSVDVEVTKW